MHEFTEYMYMHMCAYVLCVSISLSTSESINGGGGPTLSNYIMLRDTTANQLQEYIIYEQFHMYRQHLHN